MMPGWVFLMVDPTANHFKGRHGVMDKMAGLSFLQKQYCISEKAELHPNVTLSKTCGPSLPGLFR